MRVTRAFAFIDLCGFTAFTESRGDEVAVMVLAELRAGLREIAARRGVRVAKWLGDGAMLSSTETESLAAMTVEIRHRLRATIPDLSVRIGIASGPVIMFEGDDYIGRAVNVASRICDEAAPDQILATREVSFGAPWWVTSGSPREVILKGFAHTVEVRTIDVTDVRPGEGATDPVCGLTIPAQFATRCREVSDAWFCTLHCADAFANRKSDGGVSSRSTTVPCTQQR